VRTLKLPLALPDRSPSQDRRRRPAPATSWNPRRCWRSTGSPL